jgi:xylan 1,4-beta-xylosidase
VAALACVEAKKLCVMVWHYHDDDVAGPEADVQLTLNHLSALRGQSRA